MSRKFHLTADMLASAYDFVATLPPFNRWKFPPSEEVEFFVTKDAKTFGQYGPGATTAHRIYISDATVGSPARLVETVAHEMLHLRQVLRGRSGKAQHNEDFRRMAEIVCKLNSYDYKAFI